MHPFINIFGLTLKSYNLFFFLGETIVVLGGTWLAVKRGLPFKRVFTILAVTALTSLIGARLFHALVDLPVYQKDPSLLFNINFQGQAIYGGLIWAVIMVYLLSKLFRVNYWKLLDSTTPFLGLGLIFGRIGCFLAGCCFGKETDLSWGVSFPLFSPAHKLQLSQNISSFFQSNPVHPTQIYEMIAGLFIALISIFILRKKFLDGTAILVASIMYTVFRFFNYFFRVPPTTFSASEYFYPTLYVFIAVFLIVVLVYKLRKNK